MDQSSSHGGDGLLTALGEPDAAPVDNPSWTYAAELGDFAVYERRLATRVLEAHASPDGEGFYLGHLRAVLAAATDFADDAFVRVFAPTLYEADDGRSQHWFNGVRIEDTLAMKRTDLMTDRPASD